ncbi:MAG: carboxymuconolactone decarboxylase family protein [Pseudomonadales bacterium]|nr:carboxymuconolactone decarboxylase family protein [Pseudomonadales bacterium]
MGRLTQKRLDQLSAEQKAVFDYIVANRPLKPQDGTIGGPFDVWLTNPELGQRLVELGGFFRFRTSVDRRYIELAILVTGAHWQAQFEWYAHEPMARQAGVPEDIIQAIKVGERPALIDAGDKATYALAHALHTTHRVDQATFDAAVTQFGEQGVAELVSLCGFYSLVSMTLNTFDVDLPAGASLPFPR